MWFANFPKIKTTGFSIFPVCPSGSPCRLGWGRFWRQESWKPNHLKTKILIVNPGRRLLGNNYCCHRMMVPEGRRIMGHIQTPKKVESKPPEQTKLRPRATSASSWQKKTNSKNALQYRQEIEELLFRNFQMELLRHFLEFTTIHLELCGKREK